MAALFRVSRNLLQMYNKHADIAMGNVLSNRPLSVTLYENPHRRCTLVSSCLVVCVQITSALF